jgi:hypothetical protein
LVPGASRISLLVNPGFPSAVEGITQDVEEAAHAKGVTLSVRKASAEAEIDAAFASFAEEKAGALIATADIVFLINRDQVVALASRYAIPAIYYSVLIPRVGGLISYGVDDVEVFMTSWPAASQAVCEGPAKLLARPTNRLIRDDNAAFRQKQLDIPEADAEHDNTTRQRG